MRRLNTKLQRLGALACFGALLFSDPLLGLSAKAGGLGQWLYIFGVWLGLILVALWVSESGRS